MKKKYKLLAVTELLLSLWLMYLAGMNPARPEKMVLISMMFGMGALVSLGILD